MGSFRIIEDRPTPKEVYNWRIYLFAIVVSTGAMVFGYDGAFFGTTYARASFLNDFGITQMSATDQANASANLTSAYLAAAFFGAFFAWPIMEVFGRRMVLRIHSIVFCIGAIVMTVPNGQLSYIYAGRAITGYAAGALTAVIPTYIAETSPPPIRGQLTGWFEIAYQAGSLVGFWINYGINQNISVTSSVSWRIPMAVQLIPGGLLAIGSIFVRESPLLLFKRGKEEQAFKNLEYLRKLPRDHPYIVEEIAIVRAKLEEEIAMAGGQTGVVAYLKGAWRELRVPNMRHRMIITFFMFLFQNWSGAAVINYYSPTLFKSLGITDVALYTGIYGLVKAVGSFIFFGLIVDRSGRRIPWLISSSVCALFLLYLAIYIKQSTGLPATNDSVHQGGVAAQTFVMLYALFWSFGGNGLPWIVSSELFPIRLRSLTGSYAACCQWIISFAATEAFPHMVVSPMQAWGSVLLYSMICFMTFIFTFIWIPETKGIQIEAMETLFTGPVRHAAWRQKSVYPPNGIPPLPESVVAREATLIHEQEGKNELEHAEPRSYMV